MTRCLLYESKLIVNERRKKQNRRFNFNFGSDYLQFNECFAFFWIFEFVTITRSKPTSKPKNVMPLHVHIFQFDVLKAISWNHIYVYIGNTLARSKRRFKNNRQVCECKNKRIPQLVLSNRKWHEHIFPNGLLKLDEFPPKIKRDRLF